MSRWTSLRVRRAHRPECEIGAGHGVGPGYPFRRAGICTFWRLGFKQFSFHRIARASRRTVPDTWTRSPVFWHALVPLTFQRRVSHQTQGHPSNPSRLNRGYNEAPRGAPLTCRCARVGHVRVSACARWSTWAATAGQPSRRFNFSSQRTRRRRRFPCCRPGRRSR
jgi:hypothetical protein